MRKASLTGITRCRGLKTAFVLQNSPSCTYYYILHIFFFYLTVLLLICGDKTKKSFLSTEQTELQKLGTVLSQVTEGQVTVTLQAPPSDHDKWLNTTNNEPNLSQETAVLTEGPAFL